MKASVSPILCSVVLALHLAAPVDGGSVADAGPPFGRLPLVDEVVCGDPKDPHPFADDPQGASQVATILGRPCRALPNDGGAKLFGYRIGQGRGLKAGGAYVLSVDFPEDEPRTMFILNRGAEVARGLSTGAALGDVLYTYTDNNAESLRIPLSGEFRSWRMLFYLHDRFPEIQGHRDAGARPLRPDDGFWVLIAQWSRKNAPLSRGAAVSHIRLFEVPDPAALRVRLAFPPQGLPRRHLFWREEMADGVIQSLKEEERGVADETRWFEFKARLAQFLGMNTFCKDLLEFGHNQGWDATIYGGNKWYWQSKTPRRWEQILAMLRGYDLDVLPYYEWAGSTGQNGVGAMKKCLSLGGQRAYTHITWSEKMNADVTDPETLEDAKKLLDATVLRHKEAVRFVGAWFRTRPSHIPMSFSDSCLLKFAVEANGRRVALREDLRQDAALLERYRQWWFGKRREFLVALRDHLRANGVPEAVVLFTPCSSEPCPAVHGFQKRVVTDDLELWRKLLAAPEHEKVTPWSYSDVVRGNDHLKACLAPPPTWGKWEWNHSIPPPDPARYVDTPGILMTYPFNRAYTVSSPEAFDAFRSASGLAIVRHDPLNENAMEKKLGYFVCDVERAGPYCMLGEARAMAYGDPRYIGYLAGASFNRGFPEAVRDFNAAFLSLPALPSKVLEGACADPEVVVRAIEAPPHGTWLAVVNVGLKARSVVVALPARGKVVDAPTGEALEAADGKLALTLGPCQLKAIHIR